MRHLLAKGFEHDYFIVVEPGVCFGGYGSEDKTQIKVLDDCRLKVTLHTTCCHCSKPIVVNFFLDSYIPAEPTWTDRIVHCKECGICQIKKIRYYAEEENDEKNI